MSAAGLAPGGLIAWIIVGLVAGSLAGRIMRGGGFGCLGNILIGIAGAILGGIIVSLLFPGTTLHFWSSIVVGILGSCLLLAVLGFFKREGKE
jgi:uncharacterized membrane protein YeaQ/YmgE (transglycosylase-associated protein family)